jgi:hypothetical protein
MTPNEALMALIKNKYGEAIATACQDTGIPPAFVAALIANETGGKADAKRFEPGVLTHLFEVLVGRKADYNGIGREDLFKYIAPDPTISYDGYSAAITSALQRLNDLATSWGPTQIMGWHILPDGESLSQLTDIPQGLAFTITLLKSFEAFFHLNVATDFASLFHCWNTGVPAGDPNHPTFDPNYVPNGLARMGIYASLI